MSSALEDEQARLESCQARVRAALAEIEARLRDQAQEIKARNEYMWEARRDMDHIEKIAVRQTIEQTLDSAQVSAQQQRKLTRLLPSPYFGRMDFAAATEAEAEPEPIYVGVHNFRDDSVHRTLIYDWRAPIASMFYDFETGPASYRAPAGMVAGSVTMKRQFRIRNGRIELMFESGVNIVDDVLQDELGRSSRDEGMRNIVATIQRDQNVIIRNDDASTLIIQGVAGSGKTSIALHRIAYLLYRFKETLRSEDVLIVSPNRVFADYVGNVLPELGEEKIAEIGMDELAAELLDHEYRFQTFHEQMAALLEGSDTALEARIVAKSSLDFLARIDAFAEHLEARSFEAKMWKSGRCIVPDWFFAEAWMKHRGVALTARVQLVVAAAEQQIRFHYDRDLEVEERRALRDAIRSMARTVTLRQAYQEMFRWIERPELLKAAGGRLEHADVFPLIHLKMRLEGVANPRPAVRHLLIDEMQDYSPVQYAVLGRIFTCPKTILGDSAQAVHAGGSSAEQVRQGLRSGLTVRLTRSYRSTWEIMQFALAIAPNPALVALKRHGERPAVIACSRPADMIKRLVEMVSDFKASSHRSLAILAKTQKLANRLHKSLQESGVDVSLLTASSAKFSTGTVVCAAYLAKGMEFDRVIVTHLDAKQYQTPTDRSLLYVACTRAMHQLTILAVGQLSPLLPGEEEFSAALSSSEA